MLINAAHEEELRVAMVDGQYLFNLFIENTNNQQKKANIYKGKISRVEPSLGAAFVDYGAERHGFLPLKDIAYEKAEENGENVSIKEVVKPGQEIIIQIEKEERGNKGAAVTNLISLAGCYLVLMPNNPSAGGISRRVEGDDRNELREVLNQITVPEGMGIIVRTAGVGRSAEELQWDLDVLLRQWEAIKEAYEQRPAPFLIYQESDIITRAVRDYLRADIGEIVVDNAKIYERTREYIRNIRPDFIENVKLYQDSTPLFSRYQIEKQIESAFKREVSLPSGGALVIDINEALVSIDINSAKSTKGDDIEQTALNTNLEAADEIARQLRMRDLGGLIVIDFIDMTPIVNQRDVENRLRDAVKNDRARIQMGRISRFGLLEMSRQRLRPSLREANQVVCPRCSGQGTIRTGSSLSLAILRLIEEECMKERGSEIHVHVSVQTATYLLNEKRSQITSLEQKYGVHVLILPNAHIETPHYAINRTRPGDLATNPREGYSFELAHGLNEEIAQQNSEEANKAAAEIPAVKTISPDVAAPSSTRAETKPAKKQGFFARLMKALFGGHPSKSNHDNQRRRHHNAGNHRGNSNANRHRRSRRNNYTTQPRRTHSQTKTVGEKE
jgi:ribonuclease E